MATTSPSDRGDAELFEQGGTIASLMWLAKSIRGAAKTVANGVEHVAQQLDRERRGTRSVLMRSDEGEILSSIEDLLKAPLLDEFSSSILVHRLAALTDELSKAFPVEQRGRLGERNDSMRDGVLKAQDEEGRRSGRKIARALGARIAEPAPAVSPTQATKPPKRSRGRKAVRT